MAGWLKKFELLDFEMRVKYTFYHPFTQCVVHKVHLHTSSIASVQQFTRAFDKIVSRASWENIFFF